MKTFSNFFRTGFIYALFATLLFGASVSLTSCRTADDEIGESISGHWFGDLDRWMGGERAKGSEIEFHSTGWGSDHGTGTEIDYYTRGKVVHDFRWRVSGRVIRLDFDDSRLDCAIVDYNLSDYSFSGYLADILTLENQTYFNLRNYSHDWERYGYDNYYSYWVKENHASAEALWDDSTKQEGPQSTTFNANTEAEEIRGVNKKKMLP